MNHFKVDYEFLFHAVPGNFLVLSSEQDFPIVEISNALLEAAHIKKSDVVVGRSIEEVFPVHRIKECEEAARELRKAIQTVSSHGQMQDCGVIRYDLMVKGEYQRHLWSTRIFPIMQESRIEGVIVSLKDVTEQYDAEDYAKQRMRHLEHLVEINKSKDEFISIASHQLRTPATGVKQYLAMLRDGLFGELTPRQQDILSRAYDSNERQLRIVTDLLKVAQVDSGKIVLHKEPADINQLVHSLIQDVSATFKRRSQTLVFAPLSSVVIVPIDIEIVRMVIENLIDNASKYTEEGKRVEVKITELDDEVVVQVIDQGVGVPPEKQKQLFRKFVRIDNPLSTKVGGTGLGLYWAKRSIALHGGDIIYKANVPQGSIFEIILPKL